MSVDVRMPWADVSPRWGHPWHAMCSYLGTFPPVMAHALIQVFTDEGDLVFDPFSGRGTTTLEARLLGRRAAGSDLNPLAVALGRAKAGVVSKQTALDRIDFLESRFDNVLYRSEANAQPDDIQLIYHPATLGQLCYLRRRLLRSTDDVDLFLVGVVLGVMHGGERQNGGSAYASISMPNTFSMSPEYVRRFVQEKRLQRVPRDVFQIMREKVQRLYKTAAPEGQQATILRADAKTLTATPELSDFVGKVDLILTSPPYLNIVNYALQNWIRLWFLKERPVSVDEELDDNLTLGPWMSFMEAVLDEAKKMLKPGGVIILVVGDVARSSSNLLSPARELIRHVQHKGTFKYVGCAVDRLNTDEKVSRIWKNTKGKATAIDRVVVLSDETPSIRQFDGTPFGLEPGDHNDLNPERLAVYAAEYAGVQLRPSA